MDRKSQILNESGFYLVEPLLDSDLQLVPYANFGRARSRVEFDTFRAEGWQNLLEFAL